MKSAVVILSQLYSVTILVFYSEHVSSAFDIACKSSFSSMGMSFCFGTPVECQVKLDQDFCIAGEDNITSADLEITLLDSNSGYFEPSFTLLQTDLTLDIIIDYVPKDSLSVIDVTILLNAAGNCSTALMSSNTVRSSEGECLYPLIMTAEYFKPVVPAIVRGGDLIKFTVSLVAGSDSLYDVELVVVTHPALLLTNDSFFTFGDDFGLQMPFIKSKTEGLFNSSTTLLSSIDIEQNESLTANLTFWVQPFILPQANLYFAFLVSYRVLAYGDITFFQRLNLLDVYSSAEVRRGNISFSLPYYAEEDHKDFTFPPHVGDQFYIEFPITVPCVSTELNASIEIPEFISDNFTMFLVNLTNVTYDLPENLLLVTELCWYQERHYSYCEVSIDTDRPTIHVKEMEKDGIDEMHIMFGPLLYNLTNAEECTANYSAANCSCESDEITIILTGLVASNLQCDDNPLLDERTQCFLCENQTLVDNITWSFSFIAESTTFELNLEAVVELITIQDSEDYEVNASTPAISLPIKPFSGDAGDSYNLTFGVLHNFEYSSFSAYDLNYTFSVDEHLDPEFNITICYSNHSGNPYICEDEPFINLTISRYGFHPKFTLNEDMVELTIEVTIIQDVAPQMSFCNPGDAIFQSLPENNTLALLPLVCTNTSCGGVSIDPVILYQWNITYSDVEATETETPTSTSYATIGERFNMTIRACMPESWTGIVLNVTLPHEGSTALVTLNDAYVTFLGTELRNTTIFEGDNLNSTSNITLDETIVSFFFGDRVLIPDDNILIDDEQCFEIGLDCTIRNLPTLTNGRRISFQAFVETDNKVRTPTRSVSITIAEPLLQFNPLPPPQTYDGGDSVPCIVHITHQSSAQHTSAFRFIHSYFYPTQFFLYNQSDSESVAFFNDSIPLQNFTANASIQNSMGIVPFDLDEKLARVLIIPDLTLILTNEVMSLSQYEVQFNVTWHSLPYGHDGGREYNHSGVIRYNIKELRVELVEKTSDVFTPDRNLQVQEMVYANVTVSFIEGISKLDLLVNHRDYANGRYSLNITYGEVVHVGAHLNLTLKVGDTLTSSPLITSSDIREIFFDSGTDVINYYDNNVDDNDNIIFYLEAFVSNDGTALSTQPITLQARDENTRMSDSVTFSLRQPSIMVDNVDIQPVSLLEGGDTLRFTVDINFLNTGAFVAYDLVLKISIEGHSEEDLNLAISDNSVSKSGCSLAGPTNFTALSPSVIQLQYLPQECKAHWAFDFMVLDALAIADDAITFVVDLIEYYSVNKDSATLPRRNYGPNPPFTRSEKFKSPQHNITITNTSEALFYIAPLDILDMEHDVKFPYGSTLEVAILYDIAMQSPGTTDKASNFDIHQPYTTNFVPNNNYTFPVLGNVSIPSSGDTTNAATFNFIITALENSTGASFHVSASLTFYNTEATVRIEAFSQECIVIQPTILAEINVSAEIDQFGETIAFTMSISRMDDSFPEYNISLKAVIYHPPEEVLLVNFDPALETTVRHEGDGSRTNFTLPQLSYATEEDSMMQLNFNGTIGNLAHIVPFIQLFGFIEYESLPFNGHTYREQVTFPKIFVRDAEISIKRLDTSSSLTRDSLLVNGEEALFVAAVTNFVNSGPSTDLTVMVEVNDTFLNILTNSTKINTRGSLIFESEMVQIQPHLLTVTLTNFNFEPQNCSECFIRLEFGVTSVREEPQDTETLLHAMITYEPVQLEDTYALIVGPTLRLIVTVVRPTGRLIPGEKYEVSITIEQDPANSPSTLQILDVYFEYLHEYLTPPANFTIKFSNGSSEVLDFNPQQNASLFTGADNEVLKNLLLQGNAPVELSFEFQLQNVTVPEDIRFDVAVAYRDIESAVTSYFTDDEVQRGISVTQDFLPIMEDLLQSSSAFTDGVKFVVNEVFQILLETEVPTGEHQIKVVAEISFKTEKKVSIPVDILDTEENISPLISTSFVEVNISQVSDDLIRIVWDFGEVSNPSKYNDSLIQLTYIGVILANNISDLQLALTGASFASNVLVSNVTLNAVVVEPVLEVDAISKVLPQVDEEFRAEIRIVLHHTNDSTGPAFLVELTERLPDSLTLIAYNLETTEGLSVVSNTELDNSYLNFEMDVFSPEDELIVVFQALIDIEKVEGNITDEVIVTYATIKQEGIGLLYSDEFVAITLMSGSAICLERNRRTNVVEVPDNTVIVITVFSLLFLIILIIIFIIMVYYIVKKWIKAKRAKVAPTALIAAAMGRKCEGDCLTFVNKIRPLFSSLLYALPQRTWIMRENAHECREADYIAEVEENLLYNKGQMVIHLFRYFLETQTGLNREKIDHTMRAFNYKVGILQKSLQESVQLDLHNAAILCGADVITEGEELDQKHQDQITNLKFALPTENDASKELLQHIEEENKVERAQHLEIIEIKLKLKKIQTLRRYTEHYLLGLRALAIDFLEEACDKDDDVMEDFSGMLNYGEQIVWGETVGIEEMYTVRGEQQKLILLEKKLIEDGNEQWQHLFQKQVCRSVEALIRLEVVPEVERDQVQEEFEKALLEEFQKGVAAKAKEESKIIDKAELELKAREKELQRPSKREYYESDTDMIESEFEKWNVKQVKREQALKDVEEKAFQELNKCWKKWMATRDKMVICFVVNLRALMIRKGAELSKFEKLMERYNKKKQDLMKTLETNKVVQRAKLQARSNYAREKVLANHQRNQALHTMKLEVEKDYLMNFKSLSFDTSVLEEYHKDIEKLDRSVSVEKLSIYIELKEKIALKKSRKFEAAYHQFIKMSPEDRRKEKFVRVFLDKRIDTLFEISTRLYEDERKKAEIHANKDKERVLNMSSSSETELTRPQFGSTVRAISDVGHGELEDETITLLQTHKKNLDKLSTKLEEERMKAQLDLEFKMQRRRQLHERSITMLQLKSEEQLKITNCKLKALVQKYILAQRLQKKRDEQLTSLSAGMKALKRHFEDKKQEAMEKLEKKFEHYLAKDGKFSSEKLVKIFEDIHYAGSGLDQDFRQKRPSDFERRRPTIATPGMLRGRKKLISDSTDIRRRLSSGVSMGYDPLIATRNKHRELPPIKGLKPSPLAELPPLRLKELPAFRRFGSKRGSQ